MIPLLRLAVHAFVAVLDALTAMPTSAKARMEAAADLDSPRIDYRPITCGWDWEQHPEGPR